MKTKNKNLGLRLSGAELVAATVVFAMSFGSMAFASRHLDFAPGLEALDVSDGINELRITNYLSAEALAQADELRQAAFELLPKVTFSEWQPLTSKVAFGLTAASELLDVSEPVNALYGSAARIGARLAAGGGKTQ